MSKVENPLMPRVTETNLQAYLQQHGYVDAEVVAIAPLGQSEQGGLKDYGYGRPLRITFRSRGDTRDLVLRTMSPDPFGHDRRADRANTLLLAYDSFHSIPEHIEPFDVGAFNENGELVSMAHGEFFLITDFVEGKLYANDLLRLSQHDELLDGDLERARGLARYLATLHGETCAPEHYIRELRDVVGSGEGIMGLCDSYPENHPIATPQRLRSIEAESLRWRWTLKAYKHRARRTHGDFHPFNLLFRDGVDFSVLDCSRGGVGEPADDLTALSINYLFFSLQSHRLFHGALRELWNAFWHTYLEETNDTEVLDVVAPFFAWRGLVLASPMWYPHIEDSLRERLLRFVEKLLDGASFHPDTVDELL